MKILVCPININNTYKLLNKKIDGIILGLKGYSVFLNFEVNIKDIKKIISNTDKEVYIAINKIIYNKDINKLKRSLIQLSKLNITGILYDSIAIFNINKELNLNLNLVWNQMHFPTNYLTCNYWNELGVNSAYLSTEITLDEIINIKKNTNMNVFTYIYGYLPIFESSRQLLTNFFKHIKKIKKDNKYYLYEEISKKYYLIYENNKETYILDDILDGIEEVKVLKKNKIDYIVLNGLFHTENTFNKVVNNYINALNNKKIIKSKHSKGFLYKETIYKVKS